MIYRAFRRGSVRRGAMAYHPKAVPMMIKREETDSERLVRRYLSKIENFTGSGRRNRKLLSKAEQEIASHPSILSINVAEVYYNGAPGIEINHDKTMEYYVVMMEVDEFPSSVFPKAVAFLNNVLEVHDLCSFSMLPGLADRLEKAGTSEDKAFLVGLAKIFRGRYLDMSSEGHRAIESYTDAREVLQHDSCSELLRIHCTERIGVLSTILYADEDVSDEIVEIKNESTEKRNQLLSASYPDFRKCSTPQKSPGDCIRISVEVPEGVDEEEFIRQFKEDFEKFRKESKRNNREEEMKENLRKERASQLRTRLQSVLETARSRQFSAWLYEELESCALSSEPFSDLYDFRELIVEAKAFLGNRQLVTKRKKYREIRQPAIQIQEVEQVEQVEPVPPSDFSRRNIRIIKKEQALKEKQRAILNASQVSERQDREKLQDSYPQLFETRDDYETNYILKEARKIAAPTPDTPPIALKMKSARAETEFDKNALSLAVEMSLADCD